MNITLWGASTAVGIEVSRLLNEIQNIQEVFCPDLKAHETEISKGALSSSLQKMFQSQIHIFCEHTANNERASVRLPLCLAALAKKNGCEHFLCLSTMGASKNSLFKKKRLKAELEEGLSLMGFDALTILRPFEGNSFLFRQIKKHPEIAPIYFRPVPTENLALHIIASIMHPPKNRTDRLGVKGRRILYNRMLNFVP